MKYLGGKVRLRKHILPIILKDRTDETFVDLFAGGFNVVDTVEGTRIANDRCPYLIALFNRVIAGWSPPEVDEVFYNEVHKNKEKFSDAVVGYVGYNSWGGKFFGGYRRSTTRRDYWKEYKSSLDVQAILLKGVTLYNKDYRDVPIPDNSFVYCDPPYKDTTGYGGPFNHDEFWDYMRTLVKSGHKVFISEYTAPDDFISVFSKERKSQLKRTKKGGSVEKLFIHNT